MQVDLFDVSNFVKLNKLDVVSDPIFMNPDRSPTENGIFSFEIFGIPGSRERKEFFAYIELGKKFLHPFIFKQLATMDRRISAIISGEKNFIIDSQGNLVEDDEKGSTGTEWLYKNFKKIKFKKSDSSIRNTKIDILKELDIDEIFLDKWLIIPAFYRDLNFAKIGSGKISMDPINEIYIKILNASNAIKRAASVAFVAHATALKMQMLLVEAYDYLISKPSGKRGYVKQYMIGKSVDYSARVVISTSKMSKANSYKDVEVPFSHIGLPLHVACVVFQPFVIRHVRELLSSKLEGKTRVQLLTGDVIEDVNLTAESFSDANVEKLIHLFEKSHEDRFSPLYFVDEKGNKKEMELYKSVLGRSFTLCDLLFIACSKAIEDKYCYITRYPITSHQSTNPVKPVIVSTENTVEMDFRSPDGKESVIGGLIKNYPDINSKKYWRDSAIFDNLMTAAFNADFDGDQISVIGLFTKEANLEAERLINSKVNLVRADGSPAREIGNEAILSLYMMTK